MLQHTHRLAMLLVGYEIHVFFWKKKQPSIKTNIFQSSVNIHSDYRFLVQPAALLIAVCNHILIHDFAIILSQWVNFDFFPEIQTLAKVARSMGGPRAWGEKFKDKIHGAKQSFGFKKRKWDLDSKGVKKIVKWMRSYFLRWSCSVWPGAQVPRSKSYLKLVWHLASNDTSWRSPLWPQGSWNGG